MDRQVLQHRLNLCAGARVLCVGDVMLDRFVYGEVRRVSAEAPVPILARGHESVMLGAAGNVARNIAALGGRATLAGVIGLDATGDEARALIAREAAIEDALSADPERPTTLKTRFVSAGQQLLRVDVERTQPLSRGVETAVIAAIEAAARGVGAILLSDYAKGVVTEAVVEACLAAAQRAGAVLIVDSKARGFARYGRADIIKPNAAELAHATDLPTHDDAEVEGALKAALAASDCGAILVTRGARGMSLGRRGEAVKHFAGHPAAVFDVSGAGDTVLAAVGLAMASGADVEAAIAFALLAAGIAVAKPGTATVSPEEMLEAEPVDDPGPVEAKIVSAARMADQAASWRARGLKVGFTNGCFDILHRGHVAYLNQARGWCDRLIVGVNSDRTVRAAKGPGRPVNDLEGRALVLAGLACVDLVTAFDTETPLELIRAARPDVLIKGADYRLDQVVGADLVLAGGGEVRLATFVEGQSTTGTLRRALQGAEG